MRRLSLITTTALGIVIGGVLTNAGPAFADLPVIDPAAIAQAVKNSTILQDINSVLGTINSVESDVKSAINSLLGPTGPIASVLGDNTYGTIQQLLQEGFTQSANYSKAAVGAQEQITDAGNEAMAAFHLQVRDAQIRDQQTANPNACVALDGGVSTEAAAIQAYSVGQAVAAVHDLRTQAGPGMPSYYGRAQAVGSMAKEHLALYCDQNDVAAGLCATTTADTADADQRFASLFGSGTYAGQPAVNTAKDYATTLIEPVAPAALRGDQLNSAAGQDAALSRRSFNARMSAAQGIVDTYIGMQVPSVPLTASQQAYLTSTGRQAIQTGSMLQVLQIEAERRFTDVSWAANLQSSPPAAVEREIATELALNNYLSYEILANQLKGNVVAAAHLAEQTEHDFLPTSQMPVPSLANN